MFCSTIEPSGFGISPSKLRRFNEKRRFKLLVRIYFIVVLKTLFHAEHKEKKEHRNMSSRDATKSETSRLISLFGQKNTRRLQTLEAEIRVKGCLNFFFFFFGGTIIGLRKWVCLFVRRSWRGIKVVCLCSE